MVKRSQRTQVILYIYMQTPTSTYPVPTYKSAPGVKAALFNQSVSHTSEKTQPNRFRKKAQAQQPKDTHTHTAALRSAALQVRWLCKIQEQVVTSSASFGAP